MTTYSFIDARATGGWAIVRPVLSASGGERHLARDDNGEWVALHVGHVKPLPAPGTGLMRFIRTVALPLDTRDGDCLVIYDTTDPTDPTPIDVYNLLTPIEPGVSVHIKQLRA